MKNRIMVIGPNGVGKTKFAYDLARREKGEILNLDRTYLYKHFPVTTGLQDTREEQGVARHLYELLEPDEASFVPDAFSEMVLQMSDEILSSGHVAIAEGGSTLYVPNLLARNAKAKIFHTVIGLRFARGYDVEGKYRARIDQAFENGLAEELQANRERYQHSYLIRECHFAVPTVRYLDGALTLAEAKREILKRCLDYKDRQLQLFSEFAEVQWIEVQENA